MNHHEETRFWEKVIKGPGPSACWIWTGAIGDDGYGRFWTQADDGTQRMLRAHRAAAEIIYGAEAITGHLVTHLCDNPLCVRAEPGTSLSALTPRTWPSVNTGAEAICTTPSGDTKAAPHVLRPLDSYALTPSRTGMTSGRLTS